MKLQILNLEHMDLGVKESAQIRDLLLKSEEIKELYLFDNSFGVEGARIIAEGLKGNSSLETLDIGLNRIRNKGAIAIAQSILSEDSKSKVMSLSLKNNFFNEKGFKEFIKLII